MNKLWFGALRDEVQDGEGDSGGQPSVSVEPTDNTGDVEDIYGGTEDGDAPADKGEKGGKKATVVEGDKGGKAAPADGKAAATKDGKRALSRREVEEIAAGVAAGMTRKIASSQPHKDLTPQEIDKLLNKFSVAKELLEEAGFENPTPKQIAAFQRMFDAQHKHTTTVSKLMLDRELSQIREQMKPLQALHEEAEVSKVRTKFLKSYPKLEKYEPIVKSVAASLNPLHEDGTEKTFEEAAKEVADQVTSILTQSGIDISADGDSDDGDDGEDNANRSAPSGKTKVPVMDKLAGGGRSSTGGKSGAGNNPDADIYV